jgi:SPX domain protein involved in polyphosphate accumulation
MPRVGSPLSVSCSSLLVFRKPGALLTPTKYVIGRIQISKKAIYSLEREQLEKDRLSDSVDRNEDIERQPLLAERYQEFVNTLDFELDKITMFYLEKEKTLSVRVRDIQVALGQQITSSKEPGFPRLVQHEALMAVPDSS